jgi:hypothetical protein
VMPLAELRDAGRRNLDSISIEAARCSHLSHYGAIRMVLGGASPTSLGQSSMTKQ